MITSDFDVRFCHLVRLGVFKLFQLSNSVKATCHKSRPKAALPYVLGHSKKENIHIYNEQGKIPKHEIEDEIKRCWEPIYKQYENKIITEFQQEEKLRYREDYNKAESTYAGAYM